MRSFKLFGALLAVVALGAIGVGNASAASFTATESAELEGTATATQVFTTEAGTVECTGLSATGNAVAGAQTEQEATVHYSGCQAFFSNVHISPATYDFTSNGEVHLTNTITITVTNVFGECTVTVTPQTIGTVTYSSTGTGGINLTPHVKNIAYHESGGFPCKTGTFTNGTYTGDSHVFPKKGALSFDP